MRVGLCLPRRVHHLPLVHVAKLIAQDRATVAHPRRSSLSVNVARAALAQRTPRLVELEAQLVSLDELELLGKDKEDLREGRDVGL